MLKPLIKPFIENSKCYVYDTMSNCILHLNPKQFKEVSALLQIGIDAYKIQNIDEDGYSDIISLLEAGFFKTSPVTEISHPDTEIIPSVLSRGIGSMTFQVTRDCNFMCRYCIFTKEGTNRHHEPVNMSWNVAKKALDFLYLHSKDVNEIELSFYGGEPLLNFDLIEKIVDEANRKFIMKPIKYSITTNGSILNDKIIKLFIENHFLLTISLDGPREIQNKHRKFYKTGKGTFDIVYRNVKYLAEIAPDYFKRYVSFNPVSFLDEDQTIITRFFKNNDLTQGKRVNSFANMVGIDYLYNAASDVFNLSHDKRIALLSSERFFDYEEIFSTDNFINRRWQHNGVCVPGTVRLFVNVYGDFFPCEKVLEFPEFSIGNLDSGFHIEKITDLANIGKLTEKECKQCWAMRFCSICMLNCTNIETKCIDSKVKLQYCTYQKQMILIYLKNKVKEYIKERIDYE